MEVVRLDAVVGECAADQRLHEEQQRDRHEELHERALPGTGLPRDDLWMHMVAARDPAEMVKPAEGEQPQSRLNALHSNAPGVGRMPTSGSCGKLLVYEKSAPGRLATETQAAQVMNAES